MTIIIIISIINIISTTIAYCLSPSHHISSLSLSHSSLCPCLPHSHTSLSLSHSLTLTLSHSLSLSLSLSHSHSLSLSLSLYFSISSPLTMLHTSHVRRAITMFLRRRGDCNSLTASGDTISKQLYYIRMSKCDSGRAM